MFDESKWLEVKVKGEHTGREYFGKFRVKPFLKHAERGDAVRLAEAYTLGIERDQNQRLFLTTLAFLKFHVEETQNAEWWEDGNGLNLYDEEPVFELSKLLTDLQESIRNPEGKKESKEKEKEEENQQDG